MQADAGAGRGGECNCALTRQPHQTFFFTVPPRSGEKLCDDGKATLLLLSVTWQVTRDLPNLCQGSATSDFSIAYFCGTGMLGFQHSLQRRDNVFRQRRKVSKVQGRIPSTLMAVAVTNG
jgi:hypothetical protein